MSQFGPVWPGCLIVLLHCVLADGGVEIKGIIDFESELGDIADAFRQAMGPTVLKGMVSLDSRLKLDSEFHLSRNRDRGS